MDKPTLLLHACCAPCSSAVLERLVDEYDVTVFYYNPNIYPPAEYHRRLGELRGFLPRFPPAAGVPLVEANYAPKEFYAATKARGNEALQHEKERGVRCARCYRLRLEQACQYAAANGFDFFTTTLSVSPRKDADKLNEIGLSLEQEEGPKYLSANWKKQDGYKRSVELSKEYGLYRQEYCGCEYSMQT
jgi:predicted adenine nucleotide alpha hydrolase (AANH) superfamily ATPase